MILLKNASLFLLFLSSPAFAFGFFDVGQYGPKKVLDKTRSLPTIPAEIEVEGTIVQMQNVADETQNSKSCQAWLLSSSLQEIKLTSSDPFTRPGQDGFEPAAARESLGCRTLYRSLAQNKTVRVTLKNVLPTLPLPNASPAPVTPSALELRTETVVMNSSPSTADNVTCIGNQCVAKGMLAKISYPQDKSAPLCTASLKAKNASGQTVDTAVSVRIPTAFGIEWRWMAPDQARQALNAKVSMCDLLATAQDANLPVSVTGIGNESNVTLSTATVGDIPDSPATP